MSDDVCVSGLTLFPTEVDASDGTSSELVVVAVVRIAAPELVERHGKGVSRVEYEVVERPQRLVRKRLTGVVGGDKVAKVCEERREPHDEGRTGEVQVHMSSCGG